MTNPQSSGSAWAEWLKNLACATALAFAAGAGAVIAASESLQPAPGGAIAALRDAVAHGRGATNPAAPAVGDTVAQARPRTAP